MRTNLKLIQHKLFFIFLLLFSLSFAENSRAQLFNDWEQKKDKLHEEAYSASKEYIAKFPEDTLTIAKEMKLWVNAYEKVVGKTNLQTGYTTSSYVNSGNNPSLQETMGWIKSKVAEPVRFRFLPVCIKTRYNRIEKPEPIVYYETELKYAIDEIDDCSFILNIVGTTVAKIVGNDNIKNTVPLNKSLKINLRNANPLGINFKRIDTLYYQQQDFGYTPKYDLRNSDSSFVKLANIKHIQQFLTTDGTNNLYALQINFSLNIPPVTIYYTDPDIATRLKTAFENAIMLCAHGASKEPF